jgi:CHAD domain-containing protein
MRSPRAAFDLRAALSDEIRNALSELDAIEEKPKALHRCRVHLKRARALARVGRTCAPGLAAVFNESARTTMRMLAQARDLTALADAARDLADRSGKKSAAALEAVAVELEARRAAMAPLNVEAVHGQLKDLLALALVWPEASARQTHKGAERIARRARRACVRGRGSDAPARRHEWRKREKDRFYAATLLNGAWPAKRKRRKAQGERLGDVLGKEHDVLILIDRVSEEPALAGGADAAERALKRLQRRAHKLAGRADQIGVKLHANGA